MVELKNRVLNVAKSIGSRSCVRALSVEGLSFKV